ncbi:cytochrome P450 [Mycolicibacterium vinylchloridicum]|uniref:cytochrome P450 n=1 Tax=Mycolicibacterium vinylchloridicum TaxID=2736928 RepID=UPI002D80D0DA|nr:cytochrome P450 [Mycolicibacterium vinylchloridicum]
MTAGTRACSVFDAGLPVLDYDLYATPGQAYPEIREAQRLAPVAIGPVGPEILSYELTRAILRDERFVMPPGMNLMAQGVTSGPMWDKVCSNIICLEGPPHRRLRSLVSKAFTPRSTARLDETIDGIVNELIDGVISDELCEFVDAIARPYPVPIICALIGAPRQDWQQISAWTDAVFKAFGMASNAPRDEPIIMAAWAELDAYVDEMVARRRRHLTEDLLSELIRAQDDGDKLNGAELRMLVTGLLMAGTDTTRNQLAASIDVLADHPESWALLGRRPDLAASAVEETMRHSPAICGSARMALEDTEFGGYVFPRGALIIINTFAANRDPAVYEVPDRFDIGRADAPAILTFGGGVHYCLGANLARRELAGAVRILAARLPNLRRVAPTHWKPILGVSGPVALHLTFDEDPAVANACSKQV